MALGRTQKVARGFAPNVESLCAHWPSLDVCLRREVASDKGMPRGAFERRDSATETVRITPTGTEAGHMMRNPFRVVPNEPLVTPVPGRSGGINAMGLLMKMELAATRTDSRGLATMQVCDRAGANGKATHEGVRKWQLERFEADLPAFGPVPGSA